MEKIQEHSGSSVLLRAITLLAAIGSAWLFPQLGWWAADYLGGIAGYRQFSIWWDIIHHVVQMLPALVIMLLPIGGRRPAHWGFSLQHAAQIRKTITSFTLGFLIFFTLGKLLYLWINNWPWILDTDPGLKSIQSVILFRLILPGISEEILFRAYLMGILMIAWKEVLPLGNLELPVAGIIAALLFTAAHLGISFNPFEVIYANPGQLAFAFIFGIVYAILFYRTRSILVPIVIHNVIDGLGTLIDYLLTCICLS
jgi:uncharacterized protein